jgi:hypothetical protein
MLYVLLPFKCYTDFVCVCVLTVCVVQHRGFAIATYPWVCVQEPLVPTLL